MPTYLYKCTKCSEEVEISHSMAAILDVKCSKCGSGLRKVFTAPNIKRSSFIEPSPGIKKWLDETPKRRDEVAQKHSK